MTLRPIATAPLNTSAGGPDSQVMKLYLTQSATADETGAASFIWPAVASGTYQLGVLNCATAPDTANFDAYTGADHFFPFKGTNPRGPVYLQSNDQLQVDAVGLIPGDIYQITFQGTFVVNGIPEVVYPESDADVVTTSTEQINLAGPVSVASVDVTLQPAWRSVWVVALNGTVPSVVGNQSGIDYAYFTPPYIAAPAVFYRFPIIVGLDTDVTLTLGDDTWWYGADLADIDTVSYTTSGGP